MSIIRLLYQRRLINQDIYLVELEICPFPEQFCLLFQGWQVWLTFLS